MDFPKTITLRDKKTETLLTVQDFEYLVDKYMDFEALRFFRDLREEAEAGQCELAGDNRDLRNEVYYLRGKLREEGIDFDE